MLLKKLKIVQEIFLHNYNAAFIIRELFFAGQITFSRGKYMDGFKDKYRKIIEDLKETDTWSTYDKCTEVRVYIDDSNISCDVTIWDGDNMDGFRTNKRWIGKFTGINENMLKNFEHTIEAYFNSMACEIFEQEEEELKKRRRIAKIKKELLKESYKDKKFFTELPETNMEDFLKSPSFGNKQ